MAEPQEKAPDEGPQLPVFANHDVGDASSSSKNTSRKRKLLETSSSSAVEDDPRMQLTPQERAWALSIKQAFQEDDEILARAICDMEIVQYALVDQGNVEKAHQKAMCMQAFRMAYNINETTKEALVVFRHVHAMNPGHLLSIDTCPNEDGKGAHALVIDFAKHFPSRYLEHPKEFRYYLACWHYASKCMQPDFQSIRDGYRHIIECDGVSRYNILFYGSCALLV